MHSAIVLPSSILDHSITTPTKFHMSTAGRLPGAIQLLTPFVLTSQCCSLSVTSSLLSLSADLVTETIGANFCIWVLGQTVAYGRICSAPTGGALSNVIALVQWYCNHY
jgi:hypothetical protein